MAYHKNANINLSSNKHQSSILYFNKLFYYVYTVVYYISGWKKEDFVRKHKIVHILKAYSTIVHILKAYCTIVHILKAYSTIVHILKAYTSTVQFSHIETEHCSAVFKSAMVSIYTSIQT